MTAAAESSYEWVREDLRYRKGPLESLASFEEIVGLDFIPLAERPLFNKTACWRFTDDIKYIQEKLSDKNARPTLLPNPFERPSFSYALDYIISVARDLSPVVDGSWSDHEEYFENAGVPACDNDFDFELVRNKIGLPADIRGPYHYGSYDVDEEMDYSDDSDSDD